MDSLQQEEGPVKTPPKGTPSILYFIDNIPENAESLKFEVISHFQKRKRHKGGEVVTKEYHPVGPNSALLLFENAEGKWTHVVTFKVQRNSIVALFIIRPGKVHLQFRQFIVSAFSILKSMWAGAHFSFNSFGPVPVVLRQ